MIQVVATQDDGTELAVLQIEHICNVTDEVGEYSARYAVQTPESIELYQRTFYFARLKYNTFSLIAHAIDQLDDKQMEFKDGPITTEDLALKLNPMAQSLIDWFK